MWGGRFGGEADDSFLSFSTSIGFDLRLYPYDLRCSEEWTRALAMAGVISAEDAESITGGLGKVSSELETGKFETVPTDEDVHTAVERRLTEIIGPVAGKMRTGRSRNDQVATDTRMYVMDVCPSVASLAKDLQLSIVEKAREYQDVIVPGHTHLQQAQPVLLAHLLLAFFWMLQRDRARIDSAASAASVMPLGSGALAGTPFPVDRDRLATALGFEKVSENSVDAVSDRDFVADAIFAMTQLMVHLSRLAEQVIMWCSQEFGLATLDDAWSSGSSLMPQKKNPDGVELVRGKTGRVAGDLVAVLTALKGLPLSYNRDLQEDKEPLFDAIDTASGCLEVMTGTLRGLSFDRDRAQQSVSSGFLTATDLADSLLETGVPFPEAHEAAGKAVAGLMEEGRTLSDATEEELAKYSGLFGPGAADAVSIDASLERRNAPGGTSREALKLQLEQAERSI